MRKLRLTEKFFQTNCAAENFIRLFVMNALNMPQQNSLYFKLGLTIWTGKFGKVLVSFRAGITPKIAFMSMYGYCMFVAIFLIKEFFWAILTS